VKKDLLVFIEHILESINAIEEYSDGVTKDQFIDSRQIHDSIIRRIEIIGEAVKNIPLTFRNKYNHIPWKAIAGMRDKIVHEYFSIDYDLTWEVVVREIPDLKKEILKIQKAEIDGK